jgi:hypothetical protein
MCGIAIQDGSFPPIDNKDDHRMLSYSHTSRALLSSALLSLAAGQAFAELNPSLPPGGNFALENWGITLPVDAEGGVSGPPVTLMPHDLSGPNGYSNEPSFYTASDGAMTFWAPMNGTTRGGSNHPRSELREMIDPTSNDVNWDSYGTSFLDAKVRVMQVPSDGIVIIGQAHGHGVAPLVMVYYRYNAATGTGRVMAKMQGTPVQGPPYTQHVIGENIKLGQAFTYKIKVERQVDGPAIATASTNYGSPAQMTMHSSWNDETFYFKAGSYLHSYGTSSTEGALVKFYRLATSHPADGLRNNTSTYMPDAKADVPYSVQLSSLGGVGGGTWSLVSGFPPKGLVLGSNGLISGIPDPSTVSPEENDFMARVTDANGSTYSKRFSIVVKP